MAKCHLTMFCSEKYFLVNLNIFKESGFSWPIMQLELNQFLHIKYALPETFRCIQLNFDKKCT